MTKVANKAVFLDRDGVLVIPEFRDGRSYASRRIEDFRLYSDAAQGVKALKASGFVVVVFTNQPDVGAGIIDISIVEEMHDVLRREITIDDIEVCYDSAEQASDRRKPGAGMLFDAAERLNLDLKSSYVVGDRASDILAGEKAGCTNVFIDLGYTAEVKPKTQSASVSNLQEAVAWILSEEQRPNKESR